MFHIPVDNIHKLHSYAYLRRKPDSMHTDVWCQRMNLKTLCTPELEQVPFMVVTQGWGMIIYQTFKEI